MEKVSDEQIENKSRSILISDLLNMSDSLAAHVHNCNGWTRVHVIPKKNQVWHPRWWQLMMIKYNYGLLLRGDDSQIYDVYCYKCMVNIPVPFLSTLVRHINTQKHEEVDSNFHKMGQSVPPRIVLPSVVRTHPKKYELMLDRNTTFKYIRNGLREYSKINKRASKVSYTERYEEFMSKLCDKLKINMANLDEDFCYDDIYEIGSEYIKLLRSGDRKMKRLIKENNKKRN